MEARCTRTAEERRPAPAGAWPCFVAALLACAPVLAAERSPTGGPPAAPQAGAWQRVQHGPTDAITLVRERQAAQAHAAGEEREGLPRSGWVADHGSLAWQLDGGARLTVRRRHHTPMLFYGTAF